MINSQTFSTVKKFGLFAAVTFWAWWTGYYTLFGFLGAWEDEGYLIMTVKQYLDGDVLYDEIITLYGPAYYLYKWLAHTVLSLPVTHDTSRLMTLVVWVLISLVAGLLAYRLTRSALGGAAAYALVFIALFRTAVEPVHPSELTSLMIILSLFLLPGDRRERAFNLRLILVGAAMAIAALTKLNVGFFLCVSFALTFVAFTAASRLQRWALIGLTAGAMLLPFVLFRSRLSLRWLEFAVLIAVSLAACLLLGLLKNNRAVFSVKDYAVTAAAFFATGFLVILFALLNGMPFQALVNGLITLPLKFGDLVVLEAVIYRFVKGWALIAVVAVWAIFFFKKRKPFETEIAVSLLKAAFGLAVVFVFLISYYAVAPAFLERILGESDMFNWVKDNDGVGSFLLLNFATPFLWLLVAEPLAERDFSVPLIGRAALALAAILQTLHVYPVPGSQMAPAVFLIAVIAVVCLCDAFKRLKTLLPQSFGQPRLQFVLTAAAVLILSLAAIHRTYWQRTAYYDNLPLNLYGAARVQLPEKEVAAYNFLVENLNYNCDSIFSMPGIPSLYLWTRKESPTKLNITSWMNILNESQQQIIVEKLKTSERGCVVYNPQWARYWMWGLDEQDFAEKVPESAYLSSNRTKTKLDLKTKVPLAAYILNNHKAVGEANGYRFMRRDGTAEELIYAARIVSGEQNSFEFTLPPQSGFEIHRIEIINIEKGHRLADSKTNRPIILNRRGEAINFPLEPTDDSISVRKYKLRWSLENHINQLEPENMILRLYDSENKLIASLPFVAN